MIRRNYWKLLWNGEDGIGNIEEGVSAEDSEELSSDDIMSVSSNDSDVQRTDFLAPAPRVDKPEKLVLVGRKAIKFTHELATKTLNSAEWLLEMTGYGVTIVGSAVWHKIEYDVEKVVDDHYTIEEMQVATQFLLPLGVTMIIPNQVMV